MIFKDEYGLKYKTVKKDGKFYLLSGHLGDKNKTTWRWEVTGKQNVLTYIKNNKLVRCDDKEVDHVEQGS